MRVFNHRPELLGVDMSAELVVGVVVEALDGCFFDYPVRAFDLIVGPGVARLGEPVVDGNFGRNRVRKHAHGTALCTPWHDGCLLRPSRCSQVR